MFGVCCLVVVTWYALFVASWLLRVVCCLWSGVRSSTLIGVRCGVRVAIFCAVCCLLCVVCCLM